MPHVDEGAGAPFVNPRRKCGTQEISGNREKAYPCVTSVTNNYKVPYLNRNSKPSRQKPQSRPNKLKA